MRLPSARAGGPPPSSRAPLPARHGRVEPFHRAGRGVGPPGVAYLVTANVRGGDRPIAVSEPPEFGSGEQADNGPGPTGWTAGAHIPAVQRSSLPLDEWHYTPTNEDGCVRLRPARPTCTRAGGEAARDRPLWPLGGDHCHRSCHRERCYRSHSRHRSHWLVQASTSARSASGLPAAAASRVCRLGVGLPPWPSAQPLGSVWQGVPRVGLGRLPVCRLGVLTPKVACRPPASGSGDCCLGTCAATCTRCRHSLRSRQLRRVHSGWQGRPTQCRAANTRCLRIPPRPGTSAPAARAVLDPGPPGCRS